MALENNGEEGHQWRENSTGRSLRSDFRVVAVVSGRRTECAMQMRQCGSQRVDRDGGGREETKMFFQPLGLQQASCRWSLLFHHRFYWKGDCGGILSSRLSRSKSKAPSVSFLNSGVCLSELFSPGPARSDNRKLALKPLELGAIGTLGQVIIGQTSPCCRSDLMKGHSKQGTA